MEGREQTGYGGGYDTEPDGYGYGGGYDTEPDGYGYGGHRDDVHGQDGHGRNGYDHGGGEDVYGPGDHDYGEGPNDRLERRLAELLAKFDHMRSLAGRQAVVRSLARRGTDILATAPRSDRTFDDVLGMVQTAADHPGGLYQLFDAIGDGHRGSLPWRAADRFLRENYPVPLLDPGERDRLFELMRNLTRSNIEDLQGFAAEHDEGFGERLARRRARYRRPETDLTALVAVLEDAPDVPGQVHPLTAFVESVAAAEDSHLREKLQWWNGKLTMRQTWQVGLMREARSRAATEVGRVAEESCLLIEIGSRAPAPDVYDIDAWLCRAGGEPTRLQAALRARGQDELDQRINELHDQASESLAALAAGMRVEFLLPWHLIWLPVDQAEVRPYGRIGRTLGSHRNVVVRSVERQRLPEWHAALHKRWNWLRNHSVEDHEGAVVWVGPDERPEPAELLHDLSRTAETPVVYVLVEPPRHTWNALVDYFPVLVETGIPVVLAVRRNATEAEVRQRMETYLHGALKDLPERVWALRRETRARDCNGQPADILALDRHVSLVWDSPEGLRRTKAILRQPKSWGLEPDGQSVG
ncbi:hypothetical protein [Streptomyces sp. NPDC049040]|uniref:VMAP-C domain-containing protein n=1 Tax=Streptomyces sp. NPDC049040 TaxID=3365593 RepID=UPI00372139BE